MNCLISLFFSFTLLVSFPFVLLAQEEVTLEEVVVTATRHVQEIRKVPANVTVITEEEIVRSNAQTAIDLLRSEVGVIVRDFIGTGKSASVDIRGFGETGPLNTLVLVDGRRVNEIDLSGVDWTQIPLGQIERIEVVRGPGSVLYGDNAVGGVINIITKKPEKPLSAQVDGIVGSYRFNRESASIGGKWGPFSAILNASYHATEGYRDNGLLRAKDVGGKLSYDLSEDISFRISGAFHRDKQGLPGGLTQAQIDQFGRRATVYPDNQASTDDGYGSFGLKAKLGEGGRLEVDLSYRNRDVETFFDLPEYFYTYRDEKHLTTWGVTPKYVLERTFGSHFNRLVMGIDFYRSKYGVDWDEAFFGFPLSNRYEIRKTSTGLYLLDEFNLLDNLILSPGYRHEWVTYDLFQRNPRTKEEPKDRESAYSLSLDYLFTKRSSAFVSLKRSFRFPVVEELAAVYPTVKLNPFVKPQKGYHFEVGIRHPLIEDVEANLTLFWIDLHDEIYYNPVTFTNENYRKTRRQGLEMELKARPFESVSLWGNYSYIRPRLRGDGFSGKDIPMVPRHKGSIGLDLSVLKGLQLSSRANFVGSRYLISDFANQVDKLDGYTTVDAKLSYVWKGLQAFVGVNNLFDRKYSEWGATNATGTVQLFYPSPARNYLCGISYGF